MSYQPEAPARNSAISASLALRVGMERRKKWKEERRKITKGYWNHKRGHSIYWVSLALLAVAEMTQGRVAWPWLSASEYLQTVYLGQGCGAAISVPLRSACRSRDVSMAGNRQTEIAKGDILLFRSKGNRQRKHSTFQVALACLGGEGKIRLRALLRSSSASE